jgi:hypothetical protein
VSVPPAFADPPNFPRRLAALRNLVLAFALILAGVTVGFWMVVRFALDGVPLAGNRYKLGGVPIPTLIAVAVVLATPVVAILAGRARGRSGVRQVAAAHPELAGSSDEVDRLLDAFAGVVFAESAVVFGAGFASAILFHITTDLVILAGVGLLVSFLLVRRPSAERARAWIAAAVRELRTRRG